jgi:hypothetical protein
VTKGCNIFGGQKLANNCSFVGRRVIVQQEKISRTERSWTKLLNALQEAIHYSLYVFFWVIARRLNFICRRFGTHRTRRKFEIKIHYSFTKLCIYYFSLWYEFFVHYAMRVEKNYQHGLDAGPLKFQFLRLRGCLINPFRSLSLSYGVIGKTPGLFSRNNFV